MACPIPDCALSGAITSTSPLVRITSINALIPGAFTPSSFVISIKGFINFYFFKDANLITLPSLSL
jgi:hypothetical protein